MGADPSRRQSTRMAQRRKRVFRAESTVGRPAVQQVAREACMTATYVWAGRVDSVSASVLQTPNN